MPLSFEIQATSLAEAVEAYGDAAQEGVDRAMREIQQMRRESQSSIVIPDSGAMPPPGKIQLR